jgi:hypothetical protein
MAGQMSNSTLEREVQQVAQVYRRKLMTDRGHTRGSDSQSNAHQDEDKVSLLQLQNLCKNYAVTFAAAKYTKYVVTLARWCVKTMR